MKFSTVAVISALVVASSAIPPTNIDGIKVHGVNLGVDQHTLSSTTQGGKWNPFSKSSRRTSLKLEDDPLLDLMKEAEDLYAQVKHSLEEFGTLIKEDLDMSENGKILSISSNLPVCITPRSETQLRGQPPIIKSLSPLLSAWLTDFLQVVSVQGQLVRSQRWFWSRRTKQLYRNRYWLTPQVRPKTVKQRHSFALMETLRTCGDSASLQKYVTRQLLDTSGFFKDPSFDQSRAHGTRYLMLARMDALWTARKAIQIGILVDTHPFSVDHCILCDQQLLSTSIAHLVVECEQVTGHRIQSGLVPAIQKSRLRLLGRALDPGVENVYTWLRGGVLNGEADLDQRWLDGTVEHESMGTRHDNRALAARLADFLQFIQKKTGSIRTLLTSPRVDRQTAVADHFVIRTSIRAEAQGQPPVPRAPTISRHHCLEATDRIATSNYWDVLADGASDDTDTDTDVHQLTSQFLESANAVADNLSLRLSPPATRFNRRLLSGTTKRAILASNTARQAFISAATNTNPDPVQCNTLRDEWSRLKAAATQLERVDCRKQWVKHADNLDRAVSDGRTDLVFSAARAMSGNSSRSAAVTPLYNSNGIVQYDPTSILRVMQCHYGSLAADTTGHSLDLQYWHDRQPIQVSRDTPPIRNSNILDQDFSWNQIAAALLQMSPRKAPGDDGITTAFYQAALYMPANTQEGVPPTPICSCSVENGDPLNPGDKRGIALINVGLKLVCKVLQMRIEQFVETNNLLSYEQAGFRKREECVGQVVSLVDIIQRRQNAGLNTHVLFIDIRKAFDTVPVGALLWKLQNMGFPRRTLAFLKALYTSPSARARAGSLLSDPFPVQRGVRQGCPLSGLLFNLFINDILDGVAPITVPGLSRDTNPIRGLMYADDVAVFADSEQSLLAASTAIEQWANRWEMQFGVAKCGIISFTGHLAPRLDNPLDIRLHGQLVSRVESYKYLGVLIDSKLDHSAWLKQKRSALEHTISALHPVLANHQLTTTINKGIRLFTGARLSTAIGPLLVETGIGSLLTRSLVSRVRLLERSVTKKTPINAICSGTDNDVFTLNVQGQLVRSQRWFWSRRTKQLYRNRYWLTPQIRPKTIKQRHSFALMETLQTCGDSASLQKYVTRQLLDTSGFFKDPSFDQSRAHGTRYLMLARMDALWTARKAIQIGILVDTHPFSVDHCILCDQQLLSTSIAHLVVECEQVAGHRIQSGLVPAIQKSRLRLLGRALDPGVENVYTWLRGGVLNGEADLDQCWLDGTVEHESMGTRHDNRALAARLADFLQVAYRQYQSTLWKYHRDRLVEVG
ncbi:hypothetical protein BASA60_008914 [Batrachochytrium salamandrivorans]|nr:hypothetical protein BASA60_008914 [Batrachochytrium salamandrivorans]